MKLSQSEIEAIRYFANEDNAIKFVAELRWPKGQSARLADALTSAIYHNVKHDYRHEKVNHGQREYARGDVTTNSTEGIWNLFKRSYRGTYTHMAPKHLGRYVDEPYIDITSADCRLMSGLLSALLLVNGDRTTSAYWLIVYLVQF